MKGRGARSYRKKIGSVKEHEERCREIGRETGRYWVKK
jgi:hypothetical protein